MIYFLFFIIVIIGNYYLIYRLRSYDKHVDILEAKEFISRLVEHFTANQSDYYIDFQFTVDCCIDHFSDKYKKQLESNNKEFVDLLNEMNIIKENEHFNGSFLGYEIRCGYLIGQCIHGNNGREFKWERKKLI